MGYRSPYIQKCLKGEGMVASRRGIYKFIQRLGSILRHRCGSGGPTKTTPEIKRFVDEQMEKPLSHRAHAESRF